MVNFYANSLILKIRGKWSNIKSFILNEIKIIKPQQNIIMNIETNIKDKYTYCNIAENEIIVQTMPNTDTYIYLNNSKSQFFDYIEVLPNSFNNDDIVALPIGKLSSKCKIDIDCLVTNSNNYNIDFRIFAFNKANENTHNIIIEHGNITLNDIKY